MSTMNDALYDALIDAGVDETKAAEAAKSVAPHDDGHIGELNTKLDRIEAALESGTKWIALGLMFLPGIFILLLAQVFRA